jgi:hypothetical protein
MTKSIVSTATPIPGNTALKSSTTSLSEPSSMVLPTSLRQGLLRSRWTQSLNQDHRPGPHHRPQNLNSSRRTLL